MSRAVLEATGTVLTNKYSEGYPGRRYYEGSSSSTRSRSWPRAGQAALRGGARQCPALLGLTGQPCRLSRLCEPGDTIMGMALPMGGPHPRVERLRPGSGSARSNTRSAPTPAWSTWTRCGGWPRSGPSSSSAAAPPSPHDRLRRLRSGGRRGRRRPRGGHRPHRRVGGGWSPPLAAPHAGVISTTTHKTLRGLGGRC